MMRTSLVSSLVFLLSAGSASAAIFTFSPPEITVGIQGSEYHPTPVFSDPDGDGIYTSSGSGSWTGFDFEWDMDVDPDPFVSAGFSVTNTSLVPQIFVVSVLLPIIPQLPFTLHGGSVGVSLTDANFDGIASLSDIGIPVYQGLIDGAPVLDLFDDPFLLATAIPGFTVTASDFAGLPGPTLFSGPAFASIGITHTFILSPGDRASFTSFFVVEAIPEASTLLLCGLGIAGIIGHRVLRLRNAS